MGSAHEDEQFRGAWSLALVCIDLVQLAPSGDISQRKRAYFDRGRQPSVPEELGAADQV